MYVLNIEEHLLPAYPLEGECSRVSLLKYRKNRLTTLGSNFANPNQTLANSEQVESV